MRRYAGVVTFALAAGLVAGGAMGYVAAQHNPQGEFSDAAGQVRLELLMPVVGSWFVLVAGCALFVGLLWRGVRDHAA
ncbi:hypothetical protein [Longimicrobium sp.]|uniref:hypothetical protein n=1 Tax=Longimicrobium sp. TaxID=2029185 RepID=UPI002E2ED984|nr:hypothetical protein [Longimicrobium sp.]HEX6037253.1 hypothetical protein [Longimicrobium sp.]